MDELERVLFDAGWNKETIEYFLKNDPVVPLHSFLTTIDLTADDNEMTFDRIDSMDCPQKADSSSLVFKVSK